MTHPTIRRIAIPALCACLLAAGGAHAQWTLDNDKSRLSFVTVKADHVAEVHSFDALTGSLAADGTLAVTIELASVNTLIPIRDERMRELLFETGLFPRATVSAQVDPSLLAGLAEGESRVAQLPFTLAMRGQSQRYDAEVLVLRAGGGIVASTLRPIVVMADTFSLLEGVERLREVAGLTAISRAVPVSFTVSFAP